MIDVVTPSLLPCVSMINIRTFRKTLVGLALGCALVLSPQRAHAGLLFKDMDVFQLTPFLGAEVARIGFAGVSQTGQLAAGDFVAVSLTYGAVAGVRLGGFNLGLLFQRSEEDSVHDRGLNSMTKLYGQVGISTRTSFISTMLHFDFGWAFIDVARAGTQEGLGGKIGIALDFYILRFLSAGAGADFDIQGYSTPRGFIGSYGGTFVGRVGLHI